MKPLSEVGENPTIQKCKSFFDSKIKGIKSSKLYSEFRDLSTMEKVAIPLALGTLGTIFYLATLVLGIKIVLACIIGYFFVLLFPILLGKLCDIIFGSEKPRGELQPTEKRAQEKTSTV